MKILILAILFFALAQPGPSIVDVAKIVSYGQKNGFNSVSSEHNMSKYWGTKNLENIKTEQAYEIHYDGNKYLSIVCKSCLVKNILPKEHALCRAHFVKLFEAVYGKRPDFKELPYEVIPLEGETVKKFGNKERFQIHVTRLKSCGRETQLGYQLSISDLSSISIQNP